MKVDVTAPIPGIKMPNLPSAGAMVVFGLLATGKKLLRKRKSDEALVQTFAGFYWSACELPTPDLREQNRDF
jgi:hypothetical protein